MNPHSKVFEWADFYKTIIRKMSGKLTTTSELYLLISGENIKRGEQRKIVPSQAVLTMTKVLGPLLNSVIDDSVKVKGRQIPRVWEITDLPKAEAAIDAAFLPKKKVSIKDTSSAPIIIKAEKKEKKEVEVPEIKQVSWLEYQLAAAIRRQGSAVSVDAMSSYLRHNYDWSGGSRGLIKELQESKSKIVRLVRFNEAINLAPGVEWKVVRDVYYQSQPIKRIYAHIGLGLEKVQEILGFVPVKVYSKIGDGTEENIYEISFKPTWRRELRKVQDLYNRFRGEDKFIGEDGIKLGEELAKLTAHDKKIILEQHDPEWDVERLD